MKNVIFHEWLENFKDWKIPFLKKKTNFVQLQWIVFLIGISILISIIILGGVSAFESKVENNKMTLNLLEKELNGVGKNIGLTMNGKVGALIDLKLNQQEIQEGLNENSFYEKGWLVNKDWSVLAEKIESGWKGQSILINQVITLKTNIVTMKDSIKKYQETEQDLMDKMNDLGSLIQINSEESGLVSEMQFRLERISKQMYLINNVDYYNSKPVFFISKDLSFVWGGLKGLLEGNESLGIKKQENLEVRKKIENLMILMKENGRIISDIQKNQLDYMETKKASQLILKLNEDNLLLVKDGFKVLNLGWNSGVSLGFKLMVAFWFLVLFVLLVKISLNLSEDYIDYKRVMQKNEQQKNDISKLLEDIQQIGDGNLSVRASVDTKTNVGAIAYSLNFTVGELRKVINNVLSTAKRVKETSEVATTITKQISEASKQQYLKLAVTNEEIIKMSGSMNGIAKETSGAVLASHQAMEISEQGKRIVDESVERMNTIREHIKSTSKKIKMLGESSTAIGEVTGLIRDITKQIDVLALNASIQAASAGEAGRGFGVVASEVQRLALSSAEAAKKIDELILNIQERAKEAVSAMEESTNEVVQGTALTDKAGEVLSHIGDSVNLVAKAIERVTERVETEAESANRLSKEMKVLQEKNEKAWEDTRQAEEAIAEVNILTNALKKSVSNFKT